MSNNPSEVTFTRLKNEMARLFDTLPVMREILRDAGMSAGIIPPETPSSAAWSSVLAEAEKSGKVLALVEVALAKYENNQLLQQARSQLSNLKGEFAVRCYLN